MYCLLTPSCLRHDPVSLPVTFSFTRVCTPTRARERCVWIKTFTACDCLFTHTNIWDPRVSPTILTYWPLQFIACCVCLDLFTFSSVEVCSWSTLRLAFVRLVVWSHEHIHLFGRQSLHFTYIPHSRVEFVWLFICVCACLLRSTDVMWERADVCTLLSSLHSQLPSVLVSLWSHTLAEGYTRGRRYSGTWFLFERDWVEKTYTRWFLSLSLRAVCVRAYTHVELSHSSIGCLIRSSSHT